MPTITATELAHRCGISVTSARERLWRFEAGLMSRDKLLHLGPIRRSGKRSSGQGSPEWHALSDKPRAACLRDRAFDKRLSDARCNEIWRADQEAMRAAGLTTEI